MRVVIAQFCMLFLVAGCETNAKQDESITSRPSDNYTYRAECVLEGFITADSEGKSIKRQRVPSGGLPANPDKSKQISKFIEFDDVRDVAVVSDGNEKNIEYSLARSDSLNTFSRVLFGGAIQEYIFLSSLRIGRQGILTFAVSGGDHPSSVLSFGHCEIVEQ